MRATVLEGPRAVAVDDVPDPVLPGPEGVIVTVERTAICGSDLHLYHDAPTGSGSGSVTRPSGPWPTPARRCAACKRGDRVLVSGVIGCGVCRPCLAGQPNVCLNDKTAAFGTVPDLPGGQAEAMAVPFADLFALPIPDGVADEEAVLLTDILPTGFLGRAARRHHARARRSWSIGLGPVGIMALQCASLFGPARILAVDMVPERLARAERLGAEPIDARIAPGSAQVLEATGGAGRRVGHRGGRRRRHHRGRAVLRRHRGHGLRRRCEPLRGPSLPDGAWSSSRASPCARSSPRYPGTWPALVPLVQSGRLALLGDAFTHRMALSQVSQAYELFDSRADGVLKVLLTPNP